MSKGVKMTGACLVVRIVNETEALVTTGAQKREKKLHEDAIFIPTNAQCFYGAGFRKVSSNMFRLLT
jgi:hypothetical protein